MKNNKNNKIKMNMLIISEIKWNKKKNNKIQDLIITTNHNNMKIKIVVKVPNL